MHNLGCTNINVSPALPCICLKRQTADLSALSANTLRTRDPKILQGTSRWQSPTGWTGWIPARAPAGYFWQLPSGDKLILHDLMRGLNKWTTVLNIFRPIYQGKTFYIWHIHSQSTEGTAMLDFLNSYLFAAQHLWEEPNTPVTRQTQNTGAGHPK